jgi:tRNA (guanine-N7-)-methyltransferase
MTTIEKKEKPAKDYRPRISVTKRLPKPNEYVLAIYNEYKSYAFDEVDIVHCKGKWRSEIFKKDSGYPVDLEIGTGNGTHFAHHCEKFPERGLVGLELKYKPLVQTIRRTVSANMDNARIARYHGQNVDHIFEVGEINNVYIHFPDPWTSPKKPDRRIVSRFVLQRLFNLQKPGSFLEFKTDSRDYFLWALEEIKLSPYRVEVSTLNLHANPEVAPNNFITAFERIFIRQGVEINYIKLWRD